MRVRSGTLLIDLSTGHVRRGDDLLDVSGLTWELLAALARAAPEPVSPAVLAEQVWHRSHVTDQTIAQRVAMLRQALGDSGDRQQHVRTVRGRGYALRGSTEAQPVRAASPPVAPPPLWRRRTTWALIAALLLLVAAAGTFWIRRAQDVVLYDERRGSLFVGAALGERFDRPVRGRIGEVDVIMLGLPSAEALAASAGGRALLCGGGQGEEGQPGPDLAPVLSGEALATRCAAATPAP
ncbi:MULTISPECIES: winged helix-turn-helix domain-containing protein [Pacificimonas]|nr:MULTISPECIES: winged helix-turn-helix domain-containing protein [Pacificimonas]MBZ6379166.1 winged helix-turn-helix domain-containing protein [Pacificimonas aurantium]